MRKVICFHNPDEANGYLSNWYLSEFEAEEIRYSSMSEICLRNCPERNLLIWLKQ